MKTDHTDQTDPWSLVRHFHPRVGVKLRAYSIGICVQNQEGLYTLQVIRFKKNGDVVAAPPVGEYQKLGNKVKYNPHVTYHGKQGIHHHAAYRDRHFRESKQAIDPSFRGAENLLYQGFRRGDARKFGKKCTGFDECVILDPDTLPAEPELAYLQVDLIKPGGLDPEINARTGHEPIKRTLVKKTYPWCLITVFA